MNKQIDRYLRHEGKEYFAIPREQKDCQKCDLYQKDGIFIKCVLPRNNNLCTNFIWGLAAEIEITDELACSRITGFPVWVMVTDIGYPFDRWLGPYKLSSVIKNTPYPYIVIITDDYPNLYDCCRLATVEELEKAGIEE